VLTKMSIQIMPSSTTSNCIPGHLAYICHFVDDSHRGI
jgi:hypothetical protein